MSARTVRHESVQGQWEMVRAAPHPSLRPVRPRVHRLVRTLRRADLPSRGSDRGRPDRSSASAPRCGCSMRRTRRDGPTSAASRPAPTTRTCWSARTAPPAAWKSPCRSSAPGCSSAVRCAALKNRAVELEDVLGGDARRLTMELYDAPTWEARFTILDRVLASRILTAKPPSAAVTWVWRRLVQTGGRVSIGALVDEVGFSQRHLIEQFREQIGLSPKTLARVLRFGRAIRIIKTRRRRAPRRDRPGLRLLRPGALLARLPRLRRRHAHRAGAKPASRRRRVPGRQVRFVQDAPRAPRVR